MRRFFIDDPIEEQMTIKGRDAHHIAHVLRYRIGDAVVVVDASQKIAEAKITAIEENGVMLSRTKWLERNTEASVEIMLAQCLPKSDKMDFIVQKAVELGVSAIYPLVSAHCVVKYDAAKKEARRQKWQKIAYEAAKQCGRTIVPEIAPIAEIKQFVLSLPEGAELFFCYEREEEKTFKCLLRESSAAKYVLMIGPEGGFSPAEAALCEESGGKSVTLGPRILRTETAAIAAVSALMYEKGDLGGRS